MSSEAKPRLLPVPSTDRPLFITQRFVVAPISAGKLREQAQQLLQDEHLAAGVPWLEDKTAEGIARQASLLELQCTMGAIWPWAIVDRSCRQVIGTLLARQSPQGFDLEILCARPFWDECIADEVAEPVSAWLGENADPPPIRAH